jgi:hypothetical protein
MVPGRRDGGNNTAFLESKQETMYTGINSAGILFDLMKDYGVISK